MAEAEPMIASAIIVPEAIEPTPGAQSPGHGASLKRRQSSTSENDSKRPRLSRDGSTESPAPAKVEDERREARRKSGQVEERKRGQRLFGALLGTLSQGSSSSAAKRRADIEKRQQAKLKQQAEEDSQRQQERLEELKAARRRQQVSFDGQAMRLRHSNLLNMANFLQTTAEPKIYYKPWELLPEHEEQIKRQIEEAQAIIDVEFNEFERKRHANQMPSEVPTSLKIDDESMEDAPDTALLGDQEEITEKKKEEPDVSTLTTEQPDQTIRDHEPQPQHEEPTEKQPATAGAEADTKAEEEANTKAEEEARAEAEMIDEHHGETVVEAEEDTVIY